MPKLMIEQMESRLLLSAVPPGTRVDLPLQPATGENVALSADQVKQILGRPFRRRSTKAGKPRKLPWSSIGKARCWENWREITPTRPPPIPRKFY